MLLPYLTLSTGIREIEDILHVEFMYSHGSGNPMVPGTNIPAITNDADNKVIAMRWGVRIIPGKPGLPWVRSEGIISKTGARVLIRTRRCLALTNCFFIRNDQSIYLFY